MAGPGPTLEEIKFLFELARAEVYILDDDREPPLRGYVWTRGSWAYTRRNGRRQVRNFLSKPLDYVPRAERASVRELIKIWEAACIAATLRKL